MTSERRSGALAAPRRGPSGTAPPAVVVAGLGNEHRRDDGVGLIVAAVLAARFPDARDVGPVADPLDLLGLWDGARMALVVDAVRSGGRAGTVHVVELSGLAEHSGVTSTHGISVSGALRIAEAIGRAPRRVVMIGIEGARFDPGVGLSPAVAVAVPDVVEMAAALLENG
jgi:hydrogenase maturation protease